MSCLWACVAKGRAKRAVRRGDGSFLPAPAAEAQRHALKLPTIYSRDVNGVAHALPEGELYDIERDWREQFARKDAPDEVVALTDDALEAGDEFWPGWFPRELVELRIYGREGELRWFVNDDRDYHFERKLATGDVDRIRNFVAADRVDHLAIFCPQYRWRNDI